MKLALTLALLALLSGCCSQADLLAHRSRVGTLRGTLPYVTFIGESLSMETILNPRSRHVVRPLAYNKLQPGMMVVYWPIGRGHPMCHFVDRKVGTDSWETRGLNQPGDLLYLGVMLTRENYIGVIW